MFAVIWSPIINSKPVYWLFFDLIKYIGSLWSFMCYSLLARLIYLYPNECAYILKSKLICYNNPLKNQSWYHSQQDHLWPGTLITFWLNPHNSPHLTLNTQKIQFHLRDFVLLFLLPRILSPLIITQFIPSLPSSLCHIYHFIETLSQHPL